LGGTVTQQHNSDEIRLHRALQIWQVLVSAAHNRQVLTYEIVAELIGMNKKGAIAIKLYLAILMRYCEKVGLPPITALVVQKRVGTPGSGLRTLSSKPDRDREEVFAYKWFQHAPLNTSDLLPFDKHQRGPSKNRHHP
jgi:hypothetical protein